MAPLSLYLAFYISAAKSVLSLAFARLYTPQSPPSRDLSDQIAIVTGGNSGIGLSIATSLAKQGATVFLACRSLEKGDAAVKSIVAQIGSKGKRRIFCWKLDTSDIDSVRAFCVRWAKEEKKIDMLVHNAGIGELPSGTRLADEKGRDVVFLTNFLGSFLMTHLLEPHLTPIARVVFTSSTGHYSAGKTVLHARPPSPHHTGILASLKTCLGIQTSSAPSYFHSKAQQVLFVHLLQRHFSSDPVHRRSAHAFSPGFTATPIFRTIPLSLKSWVSNPLFAVLKATEKWVALDPDEGAKTGVWLACCCGEVEGGGYWDFGIRRTTLVDLARGKMGEERFRERCRKVWRGWEGDAGVDWVIDI